MLRLPQLLALGLAASVSVLAALGDSALPMATNVVGVRFSADGKTLAVLGADKQVRVLDLATGRIALSLAPRPDTAFSLLPPSGDLLVTVATNGVAQIRDAGSGRALATCELPPSFVFAGACASTADGAWIAASGADPALPSGNLVYVLDRSGKSRLRLPAGVGGISSIAFSPDGATLAAAAYDADIRIWDARTGALRHVLDALKVATFDLAYSPDGQQLATAGVDRTIRLWDVRSWKLLRTISGQPETIIKLLFSPDGTRIVTAGMDERNFGGVVSVILWDAVSGRKIRIWKAEHAVLGISFSPDGNQVAVADGTQRVALWSVPPTRSTARR